MLPPRIERGRSTLRARGGSSPRSCSCRRFPVIAMTRSLPEAFDGELDLGRYARPARSGGADEPVVPRGRDRGVDDDAVAGGEVRDVVLAEARLDATVGG